MLLFLALPAAAGTASAHAADPGCADADLLPASDNLGRVNASVICLINAARAERAEPPLTPSWELRQAAQGMSDEMVERSFFAHETPDGRKLSDRVRPTGYLPSADRWVLGENLAWGSGGLGTPRAIVGGWMNSDGHRANIVATDYEDVGIGVTMGPARPGDEGGATYVADFGIRDTRPAVTVPARVSTDLDRAAAEGISYAAECSRTCTLRARLFTDADSGSKRVLVASGRLRLQLGGTGTMTVSLRPNASRQQLAKDRRLSLVTQAAGSPVARTTRVTLR